MNRLIELVCLIALIVFSGCTQIQIPFIGKSSEQSNKTEISDLDDRQALELNAFIDKGRIVDAERLQQGRNIAIIPFKAGVRAEATDELDRVALMIVKGVSDVFADDQSGKHAHFNLLTADHSDNADLIVQGHITDMGKPSKLSQWVMFKRKIFLGVEGKIIDAQTGNVVLTFKDTTVTDTKGENYKDLGYRIGNNIGQYILSGIE